MDQKVYYTYIMANASRNLYVGVTNNLEVRVAQHKEGLLGGFTARYRCHRLVWFERYSWIGQAWVDLSEEWGTQIEPYAAK